jgi:PKHD-type hydroxylase
MVLDKNYYCFDQAISEDDCKKIISLGDEGYHESVDMGDGELGIMDSKGRLWTADTFEDALVGDNFVGDFIKDHKVRKGRVKWIDKEWVCNLVWPFMVKANEEAGWNFDVRTVEPSQLSQYEEGGHYDWHKDGRSDSPTFDDVRKLSVTVVLNDDFEGGEFEIAKYSDGHSCESLRPMSDIGKAGSIIVFPSFEEHRVTPVKKGVRYSLVLWFLGPPFK